MGGRGVRPVPRRLGWRTFPTPRCYAVIGATLARNRTRTPLFDTAQTCRHLEHAYQAVALNLWRLHAYWNDTPIDRTRTSHLARLDLSLRLANPDEYRVGSPDLEVAMAS